MLAVSLQLQYDNMLIQLVALFADKKKKKKKKTKFLQNNCSDYLQLKYDKSRDKITC